MEIKILCNCGRKYQFEVEPVNGRVPAALSCPNCGASWTEFTNAHIAQTLGLPQPVPFPPAPAPVRVAAALPAVAVAKAPVRTAAPAAREPPPAGQLKVSLNKPAPTEAPVTPLADMPEAPPIPARLGPTPEALEAARSPRKPSFALGVVGAVLGAALGALIFFLVFYYTGFRFKLLAVGVGFLAGLGARLLGKEGSTELGILTGIFTLLGVFSAQYFWAKTLWGSDMGKDIAALGYEAAVAYAKEVVKAVSNGSDQEIRIYLAKEAADEGEKPDPNSVSNEEVKEFRDTLLPECRDLASGKITKEAFEKQHQTEREQDKPDKAASAKEEEDTYFKYFLIMVFVNRFNLVCICAAVALAYKMSTDA